MDRLLQLGELKICKFPGCGRFAMKYLDGCYLHYVDLFYVKDCSEEKCIVLGCDRVVADNLIFCCLHS